MRTFGTALRDVRERREMSRAAVGRAVDTEPSYICRLEDGQRDPSRSQVERIIDGLELGEEEANDLRTAAGFAVPGAIYVSRPILGEIDRLLSDATLPETVATPVRQQLANIARTLDAVIGA